MTRFRLFRVVGLALSLSLVAAACGDDDDTTTDASAEEIVDEATAAEDEMTEEDMTEEDMTEEMTEDSATPVDSAEACDAEAIVALVESGPEEGTLAGMTDDPVATAASSNPVLTTLVTAVTEANLVDTLNSAEALTVFAPTDCAFAELDQATLEAALADPEGLLTQVLGFHVVAGERLSAEDLAGVTELETFTGETLEVSADGGTVSLGGGQADVVVPDIETANATVHLIDAVMLPPSAG